MSATSPADAGAPRSILLMKISVGTRIARQGALQ